MGVLRGRDQRITGISQGGQGARAGFQEPGLWNCGRTVSSHLILPHLPVPARGQKLIPTL